LDEELPGSSPDELARRLADAYAADSRLEPREPDAELLDAARELLPRHSVS
jgi:hypothetical protein